jgi:hypothetical protein
LDGSLGWVHFKKSFPNFVDLLFIFTIGFVA